MHTHTHIQCHIQKMVVKPIDKNSLPCFNYFEFYRQQFPLFVLSSATIIVFVLFKPVIWFLHHVDPPCPFISPLPIITIVSHISQILHSVLLHQNFNSLQFPLSLVCWGLKQTWPLSFDHLITKTLIYSPWTQLH